jgi:glutamyl-tRNA synthetase
MQDMVRVRFAPSPTGTLHVGGIRTALFNYFFAKSQNGVFILRNEDTDQARKVEGSIEITKESLKWLGILWDEEVTQSERLELYKKHAEEIISKGLARQEDGAVRFITPKEGKTAWKDLIGDKEISFENKDIEDFIILKKDGFPTYHFANVIDDHTMNITHVIRGEDWIPSTPKHIMLYNAFGWKSPFFAHVPNVLGIDGKKLSKRRSAKSVADFKNEGILSEALLNYLMLLGWSPKDDREILSREEFAKEFKLSNVNVSPAIFDERKLEWMNGEYIRLLSNEELKERIIKYDDSVSNLDRELVDKLIEPAKTRMKKLSDFKVLALPFIEKKDLGESELRNSLYSKFLSLDNWNKNEIIGLLKQIVAEENVKFQDIYTAVIGERQGLPIGDVFEILGRKKTLSLLK